MSRYNMFFVCILLLIGVSVLSIPAEGQNDNSDIRLTLHGSLNTGLTSCSMQAGNGYDLGVLQAPRPFAVDQVRFYAESFLPQLTGPVTVTLYEDSDFQPQNGAQWLAESEPITVQAESATLYEIPFDEIRVTEPYLYVMLSFQAETVILASHEFVDGGYSFATDCDETGLENTRLNFSLNEIRLAIEVIGHPAGQVTQSPVPSATETAATVATQPVTETITMTVSATTAAESTVEVTPSATDSATDLPTDTPLPTATATATPSPEATDEAEVTTEPEATDEATPEITEEAASA